MALDDWSSSTKLPEGAMSWAVNNFLLYSISFSNTLFENWWLTSRHPLKWYNHAFIAGICGYRSRHANSPTLGRRHPQSGPLSCSPTKAHKAPPLCPSSQKCVCFAPLWVLNSLLGVKWCTFWESPLSDSSLLTNKLACPESLCLLLQVHSHLQGAGKSQEGNKGLQQGSFIQEQLIWSAMTVTVSKAYQSFGLLLYCTLLATRLLYAAYIILPID